MECCLYKFKYNDKDCICSNHVKYFRKQRQKYIDCYDLSNKNIANVFCVNKNHQDGIELHVVYKNGIIKIINPVSRKVVTYLFARPKQIKRYYESCNMHADKNLINLAYNNSIKKLNEV